MMITRSIRIGLGLGWAVVRAVVSAMIRSPYFAQVMVSSVVQSMVRVIYSQRAMDQC